MLLPSKKCVEVYQREASREEHCWVCEAAQPNFLLTPLSVDAQELLEPRS